MSMELIPVIFDKVFTLLNNYQLISAHYLKGALGTCYLLSAIAAICSKKPELIQSSLMKNNQGMYGIRWYVRGVPTETWVDDKFPTKNDKLRFSHSEKNELWVAVIEKCYAKEYGSYAKIEGGMPANALHDITGKPAVSHNLQSNSHETNWRIVGKCVGSDKIVCAGILSSPLRRYLLLGLERYIILLISFILSTIDNCLSMIPGCDFISDLVEFIFAWSLYGITFLYTLIDNALGGIFTQIHVMLCLSTVGLVPGHAYSVLEVKSIPGTFCDTKMVKIRNPWARGEWRGAYSDSSFLWNFRPNLRKECNVTEKEDGAFWMSFADFQRYFDVVDILHYEDHYFDTRISAELKKKNASIQINVPSTCKLRVSMTLPSQRQVKLGLKSGSGNVITKTDYSNGTTNHSTDEVEVQAGKYTITIDSRTNNKLNFTFRLLVNSSCAGVTFIFNDEKHHDDNKVKQTSNVTRVGVDNTSHDSKKSANDDKKHMNPIVQKKLSDISGDDSSDDGNKGGDKKDKKKDKKDKK